MINRLEKSDYICGDQFSAVDCVMGQNVLWARAYGLCQSSQFSDYIARLSQRTAFAKAYADMGDFTLAPPAAKGKGAGGHSSPVRFETALYARYLTRPSN